MTRTIILSDEKIMSSIYLLRGKKVMLDSDLAALYKVETKQLKRQVKRNKDRFPDDFMFVLNKKEFLRCQFGTSNQGGSRYMPMAFTEQGVAMLSSVLGSKKAISVNIQIIRVFTRMREVLLTHKDLLLKVEKLEQKIAKHDEDLHRHEQEIISLLTTLRRIINSEERQQSRNPIGFKRKR